MSPPTVYWQEIPAIRLIIPIVLGGCSYILLPDFLVTHEMAIGIFLLLLLGLFYKKAWVFSFFSILTLAGYWHFHTHDQAFNSKIQLHPDSTYALSLTINEVKWDPDNERWRGTASAQIDFNELKQVNLYYWIERKESLQNLTVGDQIVGEFTLRKPQKAEIPGAFDFRRYLQFKNIPFTVYIPNFIEYNHYRPSHNGIFHALSQWREKKISQLEGYTDQITQKLLQAILFGDSGSLPDNIRGQFADAGMAHILAVSGMHVGIVVLIIHFIFNNLYKRARGKSWIQFAFIVISVWMYVAICEFAPSATRAAIMVSIFYLGKSCKIPAVGFNTLGLSAFLLFMWNPFFILDLGAQLSFAAMLGILLTLPFWEYLLLRWTPLPRHAVTLIALSFAAQIGVAPFLLYHFGSIPLLFWLFSIPAAYLAIFLFIGGWSVVLFSEILPFAASSIGFILSKGLHYWLGGMDYISGFGLPKYTCSYFPFSYFLFTIAIIGLSIKALYSETKRNLFRYLRFIPIFLTLFILFHTYIVNMETTRIFTYENREVTLIKSGQTAYLIGKSDWNDFNKNSEALQTIKKAYPIENLEYVKLTKAD
ncbi:MAG: DUF4131 domain-containing protein [Bacteroidetes bacterium]|jgi:competence protein ComEC|nr:DUF4131 domain-containing protein [Bacteroidota bacterium]